MTSSSPSGLPADDQLRNVEEVAVRMNLSAKTVRRMISRRAIPHYRIGNSIRVSDEDIAAYLAKQRRI